MAQSDLFDEIRTMNEFWRSYLSITITVYIILSCLSLYIVALTNVLLSMKIFFIAIFIQPIAIILLLTLTSANLCFKIFQLHKRYYTMLASLHSVRHVNRWKFKVWFVMNKNRKQKIITSFHSDYQSKIRFDFFLSNFNITSYHHWHANFSWFQIVPFGQINESCTPPIWHMCTTWQAVSVNF